MKAISPFSKVLCEICLWHVKLAGCVLSVWHCNTFLQPQKVTENLQSDVNEKYFTQEIPLVKEALSKDNLSKDDRSSTLTKVTVEVYLPSCKIALVIHTGKCSKHVNHLLQWIQWLCWEVMIFV